MPDANGYEGSMTKYPIGYRNQLMYTNELVQEMLTSLLALSPKPPVIILQGDHDPGAYLEWN